MRLGIGEFMVMDMQDRAVSGRILEIRVISGLNMIKLYKCLVLIL